MPKLGNAGPYKKQAASQLMTKFLTSYDYAQGGIWLYIEADSQHR